MNLVGFLIGAGIVICVFLIFRAIVLWYWKIDKIVDLLTKIEKNTRKENSGNGKKLKFKEYKCENCGRPINHKGKCLSYNIAAKRKS